jgi:hypothetical protein
MKKGAAQPSSGCGAPPNVRVVTLPNFLSGGKDGVLSDDD